MTRDDQWSARACVSLKDSDARAGQAGQGVKQVYVSLVEGQFGQFVWSSLARVAARSEQIELVSGQGGG